MINYERALSRLANPEETAKKGFSHKLKLKPNNSMVVTINPLSSSADDVQLRKTPLQPGSSSDAGRKEAEAEQDVVP